MVFTHLLIVLFSSIFTQMEFDKNLVSQEDIFHQKLELLKMVFSLGCLKME